MQVWVPSTKRPRRYTSRHLGTRSQTTEPPRRPPVLGQPKENAIMDNHHITRAMVAAAIQQGLIVPTLDSGALVADMTGLGKY